MERERIIKDRNTPKFPFNTNDEDKPFFENFEEIGNSYINDIALLEHSSETNKDNDY